MLRAHRLLAVAVASVVLLSWFCWQWGEVALTDTTWVGRNLQSKETASKEDVTAEADGLAVTTLDISDKAPTETSAPARQKTNVSEPGNKIIVMAKLKSEDTSWVAEDLPE